MSDFGVAGRLRNLLGGGTFSAALIRSGAGSAGVHALNRLLALGSGIVLARALGTDGYGIYAYAFAIFGLLMIAAEAGMPILLMREVASSKALHEWGRLRGKFRRGLQVVGTVATTVAIIGLIVVWVVSPNLEPALADTMVIVFLIIPLAATAKVIVSVIKGLHHVATGQAIEMLLHPAMVLLIVTTLFLWSPSLREPAIAMSVQFGAYAIMLIISVFALQLTLPQPARYREPVMPDSVWVKSAIPFALIGGAAIINNHADLIMLGWFRPVDDVGIYRVTSQTAMLVGFLLQAAAAVAGPHFSSLYAKRDVARMRKLLNRTSILVATLSMPIVLLFVLFGAEVLGIVFGDEYRAGWLVLAILSVGYFINVAFGPVGMLLQMVGEERPTARVLWVTAVLNIVLNAALIPMFGTAGAAVSTAVSVSLYHAILRLRVRQSLGF